MAVPRRMLASHPHYPALRDHKRRTVTPGHLRRVGAHGVGIGRKTKDGEKTNRLALIYYVEEKVGKGDLEPAQRIPKRIVWTHPSGSDRLHLATDIVVRRRARYHAVDPQTRIRPIPGGVSIGIRDGDENTLGTMGGWVRDKTDGEIVMLSNQHIFRDKAGTEVMQQGLADFGLYPQDCVASVKRSVKLRKKNRCDCAIASPSSKEIADLSVLKIGPAVEVLEKGALDMNVVKYGKSTRYSKGEVVDADWSGLVDEDYFEDCLRIAPANKRKGWSAPGDSGSVVFAYAEGGGPKPAVGLHFAGNDVDGFACRMEHVCRELKVDTLGQDGRR